jgi:hypothetical protein
MPRRSLTTARNPTRHSVAFIFDHVGGRVMPGGMPPGRLRLDHKRSM